MSKQIDPEHKPIYPNSLVGSLPHLHSAHGYDLLKKYDGLSTTSNRLMKRDQRTKAEAKLKKMAGKGAKKK